MDNTNEEPGTVMEYLLARKAHSDIKILVATGDPQIAAVGFLGYGKRSCDGATMLASAQKAGRVAEESDFRFIMQCLQKFPKNRLPELTGIFLVMKHSTPGAVRSIHYAPASDKLFVQIITRVVGMQFNSSYFVLCFCPADPQLA